MKWVDSKVRKPRSYAQYLLRCDNGSTVISRYDPHGFQASVGSGYYIDPGFWLDTANPNVLEPDETKATARQIADRTALAYAKTFGANLADLIEKALLEYKS